MEARAPVDRGALRHVRRRPAGRAERAAAGARAQARVGGGGLRAPRTFAGRLTAIVAVAAALRIVYALALAPVVHGVDDDNFFHLSALGIADGRGYIEPFKLLFGGRTLPTALHPPLFPAVLGAVAKAGARSVDAERVVNCLIGAGVVCSTGVLARRVADDAAGLLAAALTAVYPVLIAADASLMSEPLYGLTLVLSLLAAFRLRDAPSGRRAAALGVTIGACALTRPEGLLLVVLVAAPLVGKLPGPRWKPAVTVAAALIAVVAPWAVRNAVTFHRPVLISTGDGQTLAGANCASTFRGRDMGWFDFGCLRAVVSPARVGADEALRAADLRRAGLRYAGAHASRLPAVFAVRLARLWGLWQPGRQASVVGRAPVLQKAGLLLYYPLLVLAAMGAFTLRRRRFPLVILAAPVVVACVSGLLAGGLVRYRHGAELSLVVLAAVGLVNAWPRRRRPAEA